MFLFGPLKIQKKLFSPSSFFVRHFLHYCCSLVKQFNDTSWNVLCNVSITVPHIVVLCVALIGSKNLDIRAKPKKWQFLSPPLSTAWKVAPIVSCCEPYIYCLCSFTIFHIDLLKIGLFWNFFFKSHKFWPEISFKYGFRDIKALLHGSKCKIWQKEWPSVGFFTFLTMKECSNHSKTSLKWIFRSKLMGLKKKSLKKYPFWAKLHHLVCICFVMNCLAITTKSIVTNNFKIVNFNQVMIKVNLVKGLWRFIQI